MSDIILDIALLLSSVILFFSCSINLLLEMKTKFLLDLISFDDSPYKIQKITFLAYWGYINKSLVLKAKGDFLASMISDEPSFFWTSISGSIHFLSSISGVSIFGCHVHFSSFNSCFAILLHIFSQMCPITSFSSRLQYGQPVWFPVLLSILASHSWSGFFSHSCLSHL